MNMNTLRQIIRIGGAWLFLVITLVVAILIGAINLVTGDLGISVIMAFTMPVALFIGIIGGIFKKTNAIGAFFMAAFLLVAFQLLGMFFPDWLVAWLGWPWWSQVLVTLVFWIFGFYTLGNIGVGLKLILNPDPRTAYGVIAGSVFVASIQGYQGYLTNGRTISGNTETRIERTIIHDCPYEGNSGLFVKESSRWSKESLVPGELFGSHAPAEFCRFDRENEQHRKALHYWSDPKEMGGCGLSIDETDNRKWRACNAWLKDQGVVLTGLCVEKSKSKTPKVEAPQGASASPSNPSAPAEFEYAGDREGFWARPKSNDMTRGNQRVIPQKKGSGNLGHVLPGDQVELVICGGAKVATVDIEWGDQVVENGLVINNTKPVTVTVNPAFEDEFLAGEAFFVRIGKHGRPTDIAFARVGSGHSAAELCPSGTSAAGAASTLKAGGAPTGWTRVSAEDEAEIEEDLTGSSIAPR